MQHMEHLVDMLETDGAYGFVHPAGYQGLVLFAQVGQTFGLYDTVGFLKGGGVHKGAVAHAAHNVAHCL